MSNNINNDVARRIAELRDVCGYTQEELANELGIDLETYKSYESDGKDIPISVIYEIANKFNIDFAEILTGVAAKLDTHHIVRAGQGKDVNRFPGYAYPVSRAISVIVLFVLSNRFCTCLSLTSQR